MTNADFREKLETSLRECRNEQDRKNIERALRILDVGGAEARRLRRDWERRSRKKSGGMEYKSQV